MPILLPFTGYRKLSLPSKISAGFGPVNTISENSYSEKEE